MTEQEARNRFDQLERQQANNERIWLPRVISAREKGIQPVLDAWESKGPQYAIDHINELLDREPMRKALESLWIDVGVKAANSEYGFIKKMYPEAFKANSHMGDVKQKVFIQLPPNQKAFGFNRIWATLMQNLFNVFGGQKITNIFETERRRIMDALIEAQADPLTDFYRASRAIIGGEVNLRRARLITRTENGFASSAGGELGARQSGLVMNRRWLSVKDKRTRRIPRNSTDHVKMNDVRVQMDDKFLVPNRRGANLMSRPHDPTAPASQVCNCRCKCVYEPARDASGRLIRINRVNAPANNLIS